MKNPFELCKKLLATLVLVGMMTAFVPGCSSTDDPVSDDAAAGGSASEGDSAGLEDCSIYIDQVNKAECNLRNEIRND
jgi:hypothetical protein